MSVLDRYIGELETLLTKTAVDSLTGVPDAEKTAFGFGKAVGRLEGLRLAQQTLQTVLHEPEEDPDGVPGRGRGAKASR